MLAAAVGVQVLASGTTFTYGIFLPAFMKEFNVTESVASSPGAVVNVLVSATGKKPSSKHEALAQCWGNVGPASKTMDQHYPNLGPTSRVCWAVNNRRSPNVVLMLGQRR